MKSVPEVRFYLVRAHQVFCWFKTREAAEKRCAECNKNARKTYGRYYRPYEVVAQEVS